MWNSSGSVIVRISLYSDDFTQTSLSVRRSSYPHYADKSKHRAAPGGIRCGRLNIQRASEPAINAAKAKSSQAEPTQRHQRSVESKPFPTAQHSNVRAAQQLVYLKWSAPEVGVRSLGRNSAERMSVAGESLGPPMARPRTGTSAAQRGSAPLNTPNHGSAAESLRGDPGLLSISEIMPKAFDPTTANT